MKGLKINKNKVKEAKLNDNTFKTEDNKYLERDKETSNKDIDIAFNEIEEPTISGIDGETDKDIENKDKKSKLKLLAIGGIGLVVVVAGVVSVIGMKGVSDEDMLPPGGEVIDSELIGEDKEEEKGEDVATKEEDVEDVSSEEVETPKEVLYSNNLIGLKIHYPSNWYVEERSDILLNTVQSSSVDGAFDLNANEVKLAGVLMDFTKRDELGTKVSLGISPLKVTGDVEVASIESLSDIINVGTVGQIDGQIKKNIEAGGGKLVKSIPSVLKDIGGYKVVQSEYTFEKNGIQMEVVQMLVPYGVNNIVLTGSSKVGDNPINKVEVMEKMLSSLGKDVIEDEKDTSAVEEGAKVEDSKTEGADK